MDVDERLERVVAACDALELELEGARKRLRRGELVELELEPRLAALELELALTFEQADGEGWRLAIELTLERTLERVVDLEAAHRDAAYSTGLSPKVSERAREMRIRAVRLVSAWFARGS